MAILLPFGISGILRPFFLTEVEETNSVRPICILKALKIVWAGAQELLDDQGNMCCPDCGCAEHPSLDHVLWRCPFYAKFRNHPSPSCPLARRLGSNSNVTVSEPLDLISQMGKTRAAEVVHPNEY